jgi:hypothetical protein
MDLSSRSAARDLLTEYLGVDAAEPQSLWGLTYVRLPADENERIWK